MPVVKELFPGPILVNTSFNSLYGQLSKNLAAKESYPGQYLKAVRGRRRLY